MGKWPPGSHSQTAVCKPQCESEKECQVAGITLHSESGVKDRCLWEMVWRSHSRAMIKP